MLLVVSLIASMCSSVLAIDIKDTNGDGEINLVTLGASNTNGYGIRGYLPEAVTEDPLAADKSTLNVYGYNRAPSAAYPAQIADSLEAELGEDVDLAQLAISSMRVEEVRMLLDETYYGDAYTRWRFYDENGNGWFAQAESGNANSGEQALVNLREAYQDAIANADVVTVDLGWNNFGVFAFNNIKAALADGRFWKAPDFSHISDVVEEEQYESLKIHVLEMLEENAGMFIEDLQYKLELMADVLVYATLGACYHFDIVMEKIYEMNEDVNVVVINIQNLADDLIVEFEGVELPLGDIYGELIDLINVYRASVSPYANRYFFADTGDVETFLDEIVDWDGDPETLTDNMKDCFDMYDDNLFVRSIIEYMMVGQALSEVFKTLRDTATGYGMEIFKNDDFYTYEFALDPAWLDGADLDKLNLKNPTTDLEKYGAAVSKHLMNLRAENYDAYDYVFEDLIAGLEHQKIQLESLGAAENSELIAQLDMAIQQIVPGAQAQFKAALKGVYEAYQYTLNYAYGTVATVVQEIAMINTLEMDVDSLNGFGKASDTLMSYIFGEVVAGAEQNFKYAMGLAEEPYQFEMDEDLLDDPAIATIAVLAARFDLGNSFYAHPNEGGHDEITDAVMDALENEIYGEEFTKKKLSQYSDLLAWVLSDCHEKSQEYIITDTSYYVAIDELYGKDEKGYADKLAAELGVNYTEINELEANEIAKADLITIRYNNEPMIKYMIEETAKAMADRPLDSYDWSVYVGGEGAEYILEALEEVEAMLAEQGMGELSDVAMVAVESYAYEYVGHMINYIKDLETISEINPDALVISVGMNNALADTVLTMEEEELALGKYFQYVVDAANLEALVYSLITGDTIYVDAPDVVTGFTATNTDVPAFVASMIRFFDDLKATEAGHEYIKDRILNALEIEHVEYEVLLGDVDLDGDVDARDAAFAYGIFNEKVNNVLTWQLLNADIDGDGDVDARDAALIYAHFNAKIDSFPAE